MKIVYLRNWFIGLIILVASACAQTKTTTPTPTPKGEAPKLESCILFPADNIWNTAVDSLPVDTNSDLYIDTIGRAVKAHPDFGASFEGMPIGIPFMVVGGNQP
ncbi:MAG: hypothetical protein KC422_26410, partial [Trueperaceae bacterium]|nr:hypothetical protein [Trueperaceae bacterium]